MSRYIVVLILYNSFHFRLVSYVYHIRYIYIYKDLIRYHIPTLLYPHEVYVTIIRQRIRPTIHVPRINNNKLTVLCKIYTHILYKNIIFKFFFPSTTKKLE